MRITKIFFFIQAGKICREGRGCKKLTSSKRAAEKNVYRTGCPKIFLVFEYFIYISYRNAKNLGKIFNSGGKLELFYEYNSPFSQNPLLETTKNAPRKKSFFYPRCSSSAQISIIFFLLHLSYWHPWKKRG